MTYNPNREREANVRMEKNQQDPDILGRNGGSGKSQNGYGHKRYVVFPHTRRNSQCDLTTGWAPHPAMDNRGLDSHHRMPPLLLSNCTPAALNPESLSVDHWHTSLPKTKPTFHLLQLLLQLAHLILPRPIPCSLQRKMHWNC